MLETPHVLVGIAIAQKVPNPLVCLPLSFISHFLLDNIPHYNPHISTDIKREGKISKSSFKTIIVDSTAALAIGTTLSYFLSKSLDSHFILLMLSAFVSVLPDVVEIPYYFFHRESVAIQKWIKFKKNIQTDTGKFWGYMTQIAISAASVLWMLS